MTAYTIWDGAIPSGTSSTATGARTDGIILEITSEAGSPQLAGVAFFVPAGETTLTGSSYTALVWTTTDGITPDELLTSNAGSGTFTADAWNWITLTDPVDMSTGVWYVPAISSPDMLQYEHNYWGEGDPGFGGVTSGPISVPDATTAPGGAQQGFDAAASTFPSQFNASWYGIDAMVVTGSEASPPALLMAAGIV